LNRISTSGITSPFTKRGNEGDFLENNLTNLPWPLFFKEGIERSETAVGQG
jgi:hypothetical protein